PKTPMCTGQLLELEAQSKLHHARVGQGGRVLAEIGATAAEIEREREGIEPDGVRHVERFPAELEVVVLGDLEGLRKTHVDREVPIATEVVSSSGVPGQRVAIGLQSGRGVRKDVEARLPAGDGCRRVLGGSGPRDRPDPRRKAGNVPVGGPEPAISNTDWQPRRYADDPRPLPPSNDLVGPRGRISSDQLVFPEGDLRDVVRVNVMSDVEVGDGLALSRLPGIHQEPREGAAPFGHRSPVKSLRKAVVEMELEAPAEALAQHELHGVVISRHYGTPGRERRVLVVPEGKGPELGARERPFADIAAAEVRVDVKE